jgi:iron complex outermembrane receptor protein
MSDSARPPEAAALSTTNDREALMNEAELVAGMRGVIRGVRAAFYLLASVLVASLASAQASPPPRAARTGQITGTVRDPDAAVVVGASVTVTNLTTQVRLTTVSDGRGVYTMASLEPGRYVAEAHAQGFATTVSAELVVAASQTVTADLSLALAGTAETVTVSAGSVENAYRVDHVTDGGPLGATPILDLPYTVNVMSRQLIDDTQSRNFKEAAKYLPLVSFQEMQGPEVLRPGTRGMQGSNMQNDRKDGMGFAVTTPSALEEYEQIEVINGLSGPLYGSANPSGIFNFVTKRPTAAPLRQLEVTYEGSSVATGHADLAGRFGNDQMFGYRANLVAGRGAGYVTDSELRRGLAAIAFDVRRSANTIIEGNYSYYNLLQHGYPGWFAYAPTTTPPSTPGSQSILLSANAPNPTRQGYGQSFSGVDLTSQLSEVRVKHTFGQNWHLVAGVLNQLSDRNINTAVNQLTDNNGNYKTYLANTFSSLAPRFGVTSDLANVTGRAMTGRVRHDLTVGTTGYRFSTYSPVTNPAKTPLCTENTPQGVCQANIDTPLMFVPPAAGLFSYEQTSPSTGIYVSSIIHQQGVSVGDTITITPRWIARLAASEDWTWTNSYTDTASTNYQQTAIAGGYASHGVSPAASLMFKPRGNMTLYGTYANSIQAPDVAASSSGSTIIVNANLALPPYRSKGGEIGYKFIVRQITVSTAVFRIERPFATYATGVSSPVCGSKAGTSSCQEFAITGNQVNNGFESMLSGRVIEGLMVTGGVSVLDPRLADTGIVATNNKQFVGIPNYKSNILAEYRVAVVPGAFLNVDWQHVGRRPLDDINSAFTPQYNVWDLGVRYTSTIVGKLTTWRVTVNNVSDVHYWSTLGPGSITGQSTGAYLGHLGEPRLITASMRLDF